MVWEPLGTEQNYTEPPQNLKNYLAIYYLQVTNYNKTLIIIFPAILQYVQLQAYTWRWLPLSEMGEIQIDGYYISVGDIKFHSEGFNKFSKDEDTKAIVYNMQDQCDNTKKGLC